MKEKISIADIVQINQLNSRLLRAGTVGEKLKILREEITVKEFLPIASPIKRFIDSADLPAQLALLSIIALGQGMNVFQGWVSEPELEKKLNSLAERLYQVENDYASLGGIIGYYLTVLQLINQGKDNSINNKTYLQPPRFDISCENDMRRQYVQWGIQSMPKMAEIYPVGGAGDRLNLIDSLTKDPLPAAELRFCGRSLIENLIRDLQAREFLYGKIMKKELITPIVLMTSLEKNNDQRIRAIFEENNWFGRPKDFFYFISQPLVPVITIEGHWALSRPFELYCKPGGHGVIWKLMEDQGAFDWLKKHRKSKALVRQINNPLAGVDDGIFAFTGIGLHYDKAFGFASCPRLVNASEGMNVLIREKNKDASSFRLTNIEYTDFNKKGIRDIPDKNQQMYSCFPANTNILFVDLERVRTMAPLCPIPGMLINLKSKAPSLDADGNIRLVKAARLESTMQNIADMFTVKQDAKTDTVEKSLLPVYLSYNLREKTIGVTKCAYNRNSASRETPEACFYTLLFVNREFLATSCKFHLPEFVSEGEYLSRGPNVIFLFKPTLGPNHTVIAQKLRKGEMADGSELQIDLSEVDIEDFVLSGSCVIQGNGDLGRVTLKKVRVRNKGIDHSSTDTYWKNQFIRKEALEISLQGNSELFAENVSFVGDTRISVPDGTRLIVKQEGDRVVFLEEKIAQPSWSWKYRFEGAKIVLQKASSD